MILIVSSPEDGHARAVRAELARLGVDARLLDLRQFPTRLAIALHYASDGIVAPRSVTCRDGCDIDLRSVSAVWWRRPQPFGLDPHLLRPSHRAFAYNECHEAWSGLWQTLDVLWVNHPGRDEAAARKAHQLDVARSVGLAIPKTLITNDPDAARRFVGQQNGSGTIYKAFSATEKEWRETRLLRDDEQALLDHVQQAPVIFQEYLPAGVDIRVTVVGDEMFAAAIHSLDTSYEFDFRVDMNAARVTPYELPPEVRAGLSRLMARLGLLYGAIDLRETSDGRVFFLEINPAGQWLFIEERTHQPITAAVAHLLATSVNVAT
jgi:hypothetical protein